MQISDLRREDPLDGQLRNDRYHHTMGGGRSQRAHRARTYPMDTEEAAGGGVGRSEAGDGREWCEWEGRWRESLTKNEL